MDRASEEAMKALTAKQQAFVEQYLIERNATQAALRAGYSPRTAPVIAAQNLRKLNVVEAIADARAVPAQRLTVTRDDVIEGLYREAMREGPGTSQAARVQAWTMLGKHLGMFVDRHEVMTLGRFTLALGRDDDDEEDDE
jgi:phage terminase small subunit